MTSGSLVSHSHLGQDLPVKRWNVDQVEQGKEEEQDPDDHKDDPCMISECSKQQSEAAMSHLKQAVSIFAEIGAGEATMRMSDE